MPAPSKRGGGSSPLCRRRQSFALSSNASCFAPTYSAPFGLEDDFVLLPPFAFRRALPRLLLTARSWLQVDVCFLCLPPGFPAVPPYLAHTCAACAQPATMLALTPPLRRTPRWLRSAAILRCPSRGRAASLSPLAVLNGLPPAAIFHSGSRQPVFWDGRRPPGSCVPLSNRALPRNTPVYWSVPARSARTSWGLPHHSQFGHPPSALFIGFVILELGRVALRTFRTPPYDDALSFWLPTQERSTGAGFAPARCTPCRAYECGSLLPPHLAKLASPGTGLIARPHMVGEVLRQSRRRGIGLSAGRAVASCRKSRRKQACALQGPGGDGPRMGRRHLIIRART